MAAVVFLLLVGVPIAEIAIFIKAGGVLGLWPTLAIVVLTAAAGTALLRQQGLATLRAAEASLREDRFPIDQVFDGLCILVAGALLLTPGFLTDAVGLALFVPPVRRAVRAWLIRGLARHGHVVVYGTGGVGDGFETGPGDRPEAGPGTGPGTGKVIDGDYRDISAPSEDRRNDDGGV